MQHSKCGFRCQIDGDNHFSHPTGYILTNAVQYAVCHHNRKSALLTHDQLASHQDFQGLSLKASFKPVRPVLLQGVIPPPLLLNFMRSLVSPFFPAHWNSFEWSPFPLAYQVLLSVWCHPQIYWRCFSSSHPSSQWKTLNSISSLLSHEKHL